MQREGRVKMGTGVELCPFKPRTRAAAGGWTQAWGRVSPASKGAGPAGEARVLSEAPRFWSQGTCQQGPGLALMRKQEELGAFGNELGSMCRPRKGVENLCLMGRSF